MKKYLEVEKIKSWFRQRQDTLLSIDGTNPTWSADAICRNLDSMAADIEAGEDYFIANVEALCELADDPLSMVDSKATRALIQGAANAFSILIFENRRLQSELKELRK